MVRRFCVVVLPCAMVVTLIGASLAHGQATATAGATRTSVTAADRKASAALLEQWVPFASGSAALGGFSKALLDDKASLLKLNPSLKLRIESTGHDATAGATALSQRRTDAVRAYLLAQGAQPSQLLAPTAAVPSAGDAPETRIGARVEIANGADFATAALTALKRTPTVVRTRPGFEVFTLPKNLANDSVAILCSPPAAARLGIADTGGVVMGALLPKALVFVARGGDTVITLQHDVSLVADPDRIDLTAQFPDPRCK